MPSKRKQKRRNSECSGDEEYRKKRELNNEAVKRSRVKSKQRANQAKHRVDNLKEENDNLVTKIEEKRKQIQTLKELFLETASRKPFNNDQKLCLTKLLAEDDEPNGSK